MVYFQQTYNNRKQEINYFLEFLAFLERKEQDDEDGISKFSCFFHSEDDSIHLTYQELINILKSNASLMIYSIIEYTITNLLESIYDEIKMHQLSYVDVNDSIQKLWKKTKLMATKDPSANFNTILEKSQDLINTIVQNAALVLRAKDTLPAGNLDGIKIQQTFECHGIEIPTNNPNYRPDILQKIKDNRNNLAHGSISFTEAVRDNSISDIKSNYDIISNFLDDLIILISQYIEEQNYRALSNT